MTEYEVERILIPENSTTITVKPPTFDRMLSEFEEPIIYNYKGTRYLFGENNLVIEESP